MKNNIINQNIELRFDIASVDNFKEYYVQNGLEKNIYYFADLLLNGEFTVGYLSIPSIHFNISKINYKFWQFSAKKTSNTFLLYAFGLRSVYILTRAYQKSNNMNYFNLALILINSFHEYLFTNKEINPFAHNDHVNSERVENLVYFGYVANEKKIKLENLQILQDLLIDCRNWLFDDDKYQYNHNHGILADKGLIIASASVEDQLSKKMIDHAVSRLKGQIEFAYSPNGVHLENSLDYHIAITNQIRAIYNCLIFLKHPYKDELSTFLKKTYNYLVYAYKPNLQRPLFGDSKGKRRNAPDNLESVDNLNLLYIKTQGEKGEKPINRVSYFPDSGYVFLREHFEPNNYLDSTWVSLKAGFKSRIHKHQDDLSICLYSKGYDIFIDAGMYNFMHGDKINYYMESISAHTTIGMLNTPYSIAKNRGEAIVIQKVIHEENYEYVLASSRNYKDCAIYRHLLYFREKNILIIYDEIYSKIAKSFVQYFHLSPDLKADSIEKHRSVFSIGDSRYVVVIKQLNSIENLQVLSGTETNPMSILSEGFAEYAETETLRYIKSGKRVEFICAIEIRPKDVINDASMDLTTFSKGLLSVDNIELSLPNNTPVEYNGVELDYSGRTLKIKNSQPKNHLYNYALYIYNHTSKKIVDKLPYSKNSHIEYEFIDPGEYDLLYYVSNDFREKVKGILASVFVSRNSITIIKKYEDLHRPNVGNLEVRKQGMLKYTFTIPIVYDFSYTCKWWIYCDGVNIYFSSLKNNPEFKYKFSKPGNYVIMCSISDQYFGEFYFSKNTTIKIKPFSSYIHKIKK